MLGLLLLQQSIGSNVSKMSNRTQNPDHMVAAQRMLHDSP